MVGNPVAAEGVIKEDGTWLATTINLVTPEGYHFEFIGEVQSINPWTVSGVSFDTADWTEIDADIKVGDKVRVTGTSTPTASGSPNGSSGSIRNMSPASTSLARCSA